MPVVSNAVETLSPEYQPIYNYSHKSQLAAKFGLNQLITNQVVLV